MQVSGIFKYSVIFSLFINHYLSAFFTKDTLSVLDELKFTKFYTCHTDR